jgi:hypothetical protein
VWAGPLAGGDRAVVLLNTGGGSPQSQPQHNGRGGRAGGGPGDSGSAPGRSDSGGKERGQHEQWPARPDPYGGTRSSDSASGTGLGAIRQHTTPDALNTAPLNMALPLNITLTWRMLGFPDEQPVSVWRHG